MYIYESPKKENGFYQKESPKGMFSFNLIFILWFFLLSLHAEYFYEKLI
jgi:hypothetical protein|nr:MAG TPA: hypothetical protein [Caudoviricetes sp.]